MVTETASLTLERRFGIYASPKTLNMVKAIIPHVLLNICLEENEEIGIIKLSNELRNDADFHKRSLLSVIKNSAG